MTYEVTLTIHKQVVNADVFRTVNNFRCLIYIRRLSAAGWAYVRVVTADLTLAAKDRTFGWITTGSKMS